MPESAVQLANQLGLIGLAARVAQRQISTADFEAAVAHLGEILQRDAARLKSLPIIAKDKEKWQQDILPKLQGAFECQLQAVALFKQYAGNPNEGVLVQGLNLIQKAGELTQPLRSPGVISAGIQQALETGLGMLQSRDALMLTGLGEAAPALGITAAPAAIVALAGVGLLAGSYAVSNTG